jgi:hypothetical protein
MLAGVDDSSSSDKQHATSAEKMEYEAFDDAGGAEPANPAIVVVSDSTEPIPPVIARRSSATEMRAATPQGNIDCLTGLRGVCALMVAWVHISELRG